MLDIAVLTAGLLPVLHKALPYLLNLGGKAAEEAAKHIGGDAWDTAKAAWEKIRGKHPALEAAAQQTAETPSDETAKQLFDLQFSRALQKDPALAKALSGILQNYQVQGNENTVIGGNQDNTMNFNQAHISGPVIAHSQFMVTLI